MKREQVAALAKGKDDVELHEVGRKYGLLNLACDFDGVDATAEPHTSEQFTRENPFVHLAIREGHIQPLKQDISMFSEVKCFTTGKDKTVFKSLRPEADGGGKLPIEHTLFKGEREALLAAVAPAK